MSKLNIILTGIKPTGAIHLGNYLGAIKPTVKEAAKADIALFMVADMHALISIKEPKELQNLTHQAENFLNRVTALLPNAVIFRQSQIPQIFELAQILAAFTAKGLLNRSHAYKAAQDLNRENNLPPDSGINCGLYTYPILMAADILCFGSTKVPVGKDQIQHLEITRAVANTFNHQVGSTFILPEPIIVEEEPLPGTDGRKMSKSHMNTIPFLAELSEIKTAVKNIVTDSKGLEEPKNPDSCIPYQIYRVIVGTEKAQTMKAKLLKGGYGYGHAKDELVEAIFLEQDQYNEKPCIKTFSISDVQELASSTLANVKRQTGLS